MICVEIDELTPCLKDTETGDIVETEVIRIKRTSFLSKFNKKTGWYINWNDLASECNIYALVIKGTVNIQGMVALQASEEMQVEYISWMVAAPENNKQIATPVRYTGVGGHLFAIAIRESVKHGFGGAVSGYAANRDLLDHYCKNYGGIHIGALHPFQFIIEGKAAIDIVERYTYNEADDEL